MKSKTVSGVFGILVLSILVINHIIFSSSCSATPNPDIKANNSDGPVIITESDNLSLTLELDPGSQSGSNADWWAVASTPFGWYYYNAYTGSWMRGLSCSYQGPLVNLAPVQVLNSLGIPAGTYTFYFGVDTAMNCSLDFDQLYYDNVDVLSLMTAVASNQSTETLCAEEDNVNIPILGNIQSFTIEATHPTYDVGTDNCEPDFTNCPPSEPGYPFTPVEFELFNDGETVVKAIRESEWWRPNGMDVSVNDNTPATDIHYVVVYRKISGADDWPQYFVLYMDGNLRLKPHHPTGVGDVCFASSVIIGPASAASRPIAEITSAKYYSASKTMEILYKAGGSAILDLSEVNRTVARVRVTVNYPTNVPFATFRSMFVEDGNADVDHVEWKDASNEINDDAIMTFPGGEGTEWFFYRSTRSQHNTSAPDIRIKLN